MIEFFSQNSPLIFKSLTGAIGGLLLSILMVHNNEYKPPSRRYARRHYVIHFLLWPFVGLVLSGIHLVDGSQMSYFLCFQTGLTGPVIIQSIISKRSEIVETPEGA